MDKFRQRVKQILDEVVDPQLVEIRRLFLTSNEHVNPEFDPKQFRNLFRLCQDIKTEVKTIETVVKAFPLPKEDEEDDERDEDDSPVPLEDRDIARKNYYDWITRKHPDWSDETRMIITNGVIDNSPQRVIKEWIIKGGEWINDHLNAFTEGAAKGAGQGLTKALTEIVVHGIDKIIKLLTDTSTKTASSIDNDLEARWKGEWYPQLEKLLLEIQKRVLDAEFTILDKIDKIQDWISDVDNHISSLIDGLMVEFTSRFDKQQEMLEQILDNLEICCQTLKSRLTEEFNDVHKHINELQRPSQYVYNTDGDVRRRLGQIYGAITELRGLL